MGFDEGSRSSRRQELLIDRAQTMLLMAVDTARTAGHATVTLDEHRTPTARAAAHTAQARAEQAAHLAWQALEQLRAHHPPIDDTFHVRARVAVDVELNVTVDATLTVTMDPPTT